MGGHRRVIGKNHPAWDDSDHRARRIIPIRIVVLSWEFSEPDSVSAARILIIEDEEVLLTLLQYNLAA